jgi:hypothetical protein
LPLQLQLRSLSLVLRRHPERSEGSPQLQLQLQLQLPVLPSNPPQTNVISTEAAHSLIVSSAVERSLYSLLPPPLPPPTPLLGRPAIAVAITVAYAFAPIACFTPVILSEAKNPPILFSRPPKPVKPPNAKNPRQSRRNHLSHEFHRNSYAR